MRQQLIAKEHFRRGNALLSSLRLALAYSPASPTNRTRPSRIARRSFLIVCTVVTSGVLPEKIQSASAHHRG